jgi:hypothetical protein
MHKLSFRYVGSEVLTAAVMKSSFYLLRYIDLQPVESQPASRKEHVASILKVKE